DLYDQGHQRPCSDRVENLTFPLYRPSFLFYLVCTPCTPMFILIKIYIYKLDNAGQSVSVSGIKKHYQDSKKVLLKILNQDCSSKLQIYKYQEAQFAKKVIDNYMIGMPILKVREQIKEIDLYIKNKDFAVYRLMKNKSLFLMRISNYFSVYIEILYKSLRNLDDR
ncbi:MAG: hypothetical protein ACLROU_09385, partial [Lachnospiraceae bacterium]